MNLIALTMSSREIAELTEKRHDNVLADIRTMLSELNKDVLTFQGIYFDSMNREQVEFHLDRELTETLITGYSVVLRNKVIRRLHELEAQALRPMTQAEITAANANQLVEVERQQREQRVAIAQIEDRVSQVEHTRYFEGVPAGFESTTGLRARIGLRHGVPHWVINEVMRALPYCPRPYGFVKSKHASEGGKPYPVYPIADITRLFDRFVSECTYETEQFATHPDIQQGRFKLCRRKTV